jgi:choline dehydrogenase-like flavoprotein
MLDEANMPYSSCVRCSTCDGFPCLVHAKSDAEVLGVRPALEHENVTLLTHARVVKLNTNPAGTAITEVVVERGDGRDGASETETGAGAGGAGGETETYSADIVVVSAGAANTAKLLLNSASETHPDGLANGSGQVGRNYMFHDSQAVLAISKEPNPTVFQKTLGVNDFYFAGEAWEFPMGNIQMVGKSVADMYRGEQPLLTKLAPTFSLQDVAEHAVDFWLSTEDLPRPENRVTLDGDGNVKLSYKPSNDVARDRLFKQLRSLLGHLGMHEHHLIPRWAYLENKIPVAGVAHQAGTCRFGSDPASSALDTDCKAHELDNLYVVDTSFFPSISAVNPALTAMANAVRVGDHLLERLGANGG